MRCVYCDTAYAFNGGKSLSVDDIVTCVAEYGAHYVTVTGGEPLAQKECLPLLRLLCDAGYSVSLETGGAIAIDDIDPRVSIILDIKTPDSGVLFSPVYGKLNQTELGEWVLQDRLPVRMQVQLHKILWGETPGK